MPLSKRQAANLLIQQGDPENVTNNDFTADQGDGVATSAGDVNVFAESELGETSGKMDEWRSLILGQNPDGAIRTAQGKPRERFRSATPADLDTNTEARVVRTKSGEIDGKTLFAWHLYDDYNVAGGSVAIDEVPPLRPVRRPVVEGEIVRVLLRNENTSITPSFSDSSFRYPVIAVR